MGWDGMGMGMNAIVREIAEFSSKLNRAVYRVVSENSSCPYKVRKTSTSTVSIVPGSVQSTSYETPSGFAAPNTLARGSV